MPVSEQTRQVVTRLKEGRVISIISTPIRRLADARSLILLSQMVYWTTRNKTVLEADGWFSKPTQEWMMETGLTRSYVASCLNTLRERRIVKVWQRATKTAPWFKVDLGQLYVLCQGQAAESNIPLSQFINDAAFREAIVGRPLPYYTLLSDAVGDALLGLFLSRCVYWQEALEQRNRLNTRKPTWGWSSNDWTNDIGISRTQLRILLKQASEQRLIEVTETDRPFPGIWVDFTQIIKAITMPVHGCSVNSVDGTSMDGETVHESAVHSEDGGFVDAVRAGIKTPLLDGAPSTFPPSTVRMADSWTESSADPNEISTSQTDQQCTKSNHSAAKYTHPDDGFNQSTRARGVDYRDYTTTTTAVGDKDSKNPSSLVVVVDSANADQNQDALIFPSKLSTRELHGIERTIATALPQRRQALLDELGERLLRKQPHNPISYLRSLVSADNKADGGLVLELAHIAVARREREAELARLRNAPAVDPVQAPTTRAPEHADPGERQKRVDRAKAALKGRPVEQTEENAV